MAISKFTLDFTAVEKPTLRTIQKAFLDANLGATISINIGQPPKVTTTTIENLPPDLLNNVATDTITFNWIPVPHKGLTRPITAQEVNKLATTLGLLRDVASNDICLHPDAGLLESNKIYLKYQAGKSNAYISIWSNNKEFCYKINENKNPELFRAVTDSAAKLAKNNALDNDDHLALIREYVSTYAVQTFTSDSSPAISLSDALKQDAQAIPQEFDPLQRLKGAIIDNLGNSKNAADNLVRELEGLLIQNPKCKADVEKIAVETIGLIFEYNNLVVNGATTSQDNVHPTATIKNDMKQFKNKTKSYINTVQKLSVPRKIVVAACAFAGTLVGAALGLAAGLTVGLTVGAAIGGGVGSVVPVFGNVAGAIGGGTVGGLAAAVVSAGKGAAIGTLVGGAIGAGVAGFFAAKTSAAVLSNAARNNAQDAAVDFAKSLKSDAQGKTNAAINPLKVPKV